MGNIFLPHRFKVFGHFQGPVATPLSPTPPLTHKPYGELGQPFPHHKCAKPRAKG